MKVVVNLAMATELNLKAKAAFGQQLDKSSIVCGIVKDRLPIVPAIDNVIETASGRKALSS